MKTLLTFVVVMLTTFGLSACGDEDLVMEFSQTPALDEARRLAEQGIAGAQNNLGVMYANGEGVPQNDAEAVKWYRLSAEQGNAMAQYNLGVMYANGEGVPQDYARSYLWFSMAATQGFEGASENRDLAGALLTAEALISAQQLATRCFDSGFKDCD